jgi:hypothetical protein
MFPSERRTTCRRKLHLPLRFRRQNALIEGENGATSVNVSTSGVYFISSLPLLVGEKIEVSMKMPRKITFEKASKRLFTGRVTHVDSQGSPTGFSRIGVHLLYYLLVGRQRALTNRVGCSHELKQIVRAGRGKVLDYYPVDL